MFKFAFSWWHMWNILFHMLICHMHTFFGEVLGSKAFGTLLIGLLVFLLLSFISSLYILDNSFFFFFNQIGLLQIYSPSMWFFFSYEFPFLVCSYDRLHYLIFECLKQPCLPWINSTWSWCIILFISCWIRFANIWLRISASIFMKDICL